MSNGEWNRQDPFRTLGIGFLNRRGFSSIEELAEWMVKALPLILNAENQGGKKDFNQWSWSWNYKYEVIPQELYEIYNSWMEKIIENEHFTVGGEKWPIEGTPWPRQHWGGSRFLYLLKYKLIKKGFLKGPDEISESGWERENPYGYLGIGLLNRTEFSGTGDLAQWLVDILPIIYNTKKEGIQRIIKGLKWKYGKIIPQELFEKYSSWINSNIEAGSKSIGGAPWPGQGVYWDWAKGEAKGLVENIKGILLEKGYLPDQEKLKLDESKWERGDPYKTLGIGLINRTEFPSIDDFVKWLVDILPFIYGLSKEKTKFLTNNLEWKNSYIIPNDLYREYMDWITSNIELNSKIIEGKRWPSGYGTTWAMIRDKDYQNIIIQDIQDQLIKEGYINWNLRESWERRDPYGSLRIGSRYKNKFSNREEFQKWLVDLLPQIFGKSEKEVIGEIKRMHWDKTSTILPKDLYQIYNVWIRANIETGSIDLWGAPWPERKDLWMIKDLGDGLIPIHLIKNELEERFGI